MLPYLIAGCLMLFAGCAALLWQNVSMRRELATSHSKARADACERSLLIKEINHRVKNTLQLFQSLLSLEQRRIAVDDHPQQSKWFHVFGARLRTMSLIFRDIYGQDESTDVDLGQLIDNVVGQSGLLRPVDRVELDLEPGIIVDLDTANALALIACEVMLVVGCDETNPGPSLISIALRAVPDGFVIHFEDGSQCLKPIFKKGSLNETIISDLAVQIEASLEVGFPGPSGNPSFEITLQRTG